MTDRSIYNWLEIYTAHAFDHAELIRRVRGAD
jgi:hypothetical protein